MSERLGIDLDKNDPEEVLFYDVNYEPPAAITQRIISLSGITDNERVVYKLHASGLSSSDISRYLEKNKSTVSGLVRTSSSKVRNVLRAERIIVDGVPVPLHRRREQTDENEEGWNE